MTVINRDHYLKQLVKSQFNGRVKVITGIRRCGKSFLLSTIYRAHLLKSGVSNDCIIDIDLEKREHASLRNPELLYDYVLQHVASPQKHYVFVDEIQLSYRVKRDEIDEELVPPEDRDLLYTTFYDVLNDLIGRENIDG